MRPTFRHIVLPLEFDPDRADSIDWRKEAGELLSPERFSSTYWAENFVKLPPEIRSAQYQQDPLERGLGLYKQEEFKRWESWADLPRDGVWSVSIDPAQKGRARTKVDKARALRSYWVAQAWLKSGRDRVLLRQVRFRDDFAVALDTIGLFISRLIIAIRQHKRANKCMWSPGILLIEEQAAGPQAISVWETTKVPGGLAIEPYKTGTKSKLERAEACLPTVRSGCVWLPDESKAADTGCMGLASRLCAFPRGKYDDEVDALTQYLLWNLDKTLDLDKMLINLRKLAKSA